MCDHCLHLNRSQFQRLREHLFRDEREQVAFLFAHDEGDASGDSVELHVEELHCVSPGEFDFQFSYHVSLTDQALAAVVKRAWDLGAVPVEVHSHLSSEYPAGFSISDVRGFRETVPHVRWRLRGVPYVAMVFAPNSFDALVWRGGGGRVEPLSRFQVGDESCSPTGISYRKLRHDE